jgi:hypothetical protein
MYTHDIEKNSQYIVYLCLLRSATITPVSHHIHVYHLKQEGIIWSRGYHLEQRVSSGAEGIIWSRGYHLEQEGNIEGEEYHLERCLSPGGGGYHLEQASIICRGRVSSGTGEYHPAGEGIIWKRRVSFGGVGYHLEQESIT